MRHDDISYGPRYWLLKKMPAGVDCWIFKTNHVKGNSAYYSLQPHPSGITIRIITKGEWTVSMNNIETTASHGDIFCAFPDTVIEFFTQKNEPWEWYEIQLNGTAASACVAAFGCSEKKPVHTPKAPEQALALFKQIYYYMNNPKRCIWEMLSLQYQLIHACNPMPDLSNYDETSAEMLVSKVIDSMESLPVNKKNISELAEELGVDRTTLRRQFVKKVGMNPSEFIKKIQMERACDLLSVTDLKVAKIAELVGFANEKYFIRCFREKTGLPPKKWKNR